MKILKEEKAINRRKILRLNILAAFIVFVVSFYLVTTGDYTNFEERKSAYTVFNALIIGSLLYMAFIWIYCVMTKPFWFPKNKG